MIELASAEQLKKAVKKYFAAVKDVFRSGNIETTYNKPIIDLVELFGCKAIDFSGGRSGSVGENIDIKLWQTDDDINGIEPFAAIEVKKVGGIDARAKSNILTEANRYGNVILTDNRLWEFWRAGEKERYNAFVLMDVDEKKELKLNESKIDLFIQSIKDFILAEPTNIKSSNRLAFYMAEYAKSIREIIRGILQAGASKPMYNELFALYSKLKQELLPELNENAFADMYAQTIVYGLFIARYNDDITTKLNRSEAITNLSKESHLLKQFFQHISTSGNLHPTLNDTIEKLVKLFNIANLPELLDQYEKRDTIVHFYEDFLGFYDPAQRKAFGAYYTPVQVVRYMVGMVDKMLVDEFGISKGLSDNSTIDITVKSDPYAVGKKTLMEKTISVPQVAILDPACGTGTFGAEIIKFVKDKYFSGANAAFYKKWIQDKNGLLSRLIAFEIMMTSYVVAHLKIRRTITETLGQQPDEILTSNIFLTNTLAEPKSTVERNAQFTMFDFSGAITEEAENADKWKTRRPIKVIIGNPPYNRLSLTPFDISVYRTETDGKSNFGERKDCLSDDYVKFIRFSEQRIERDGSGILAFITNNAYFDNPTARGMRASLLRTFDKIYILNLHGNAKKKDTAPDGSKDVNVFEIQQGVGIIIAIKTTKSTEWARVYYADLYGTREKKLQALDDKSFTFCQLELERKMAYFIPQKTVGKSDYESGVSINELFASKKIGIESGNDSVAFTLTRAELEKKIDIVKIAIDDKPIKQLFGKFNSGQTANKIQNDILNQRGTHTQVAYRPFDDRWTYYSSNSCAWLFRPRGEIMNNFVNDNLKHNYGLCFTRSDKSPRKYSMMFVTNKVTERCILTTQTAGNATVAPLYIAPSELVKEWTPNFNQEQLAKLTQNLKEKPSAVEVFDYCYGVLYDPTYREKYNEFLKRDFPRVPIIENEKSFAIYKIAGERLRKLHLMQTDEKLELTFEPTAPSNLNIEAPKYIDGKLQINKDTKIIGIPQEVWNYYIGGYQVLDKWFKSHKGEELDIDKFTHIQKVAGILAQTIKVQEELRKR